MLGGWQQAWIATRVSPLSDTHRSQWWIGQSLEYTDSEYFNFRKQGRQILLTRRNNNFPSKLLDHIHILGHRQGTYYAHLLLPYIFYLLTQDLDGNEAHETGEVNLLSECQGMVIQLNDNKCHWSCEFMLSIRITIMAHKPVTRCGFHKNTNETVRIWFVGECMDLHW